MEPAVLIQAREQDYGAVEAAIKEAVVVYSSKSGLDAPQVVIDKEHPLPTQR